MDSLKSKIMGFVKPVTMAATAVGMSMMGAVTAFAASGDTFLLTAPSVDNSQVATGGTGLLAFMASLLQNHIVLLFMVIGISMGVGFITHVLVGSIFRTKRG